ncbi:Uncharacterised protein [Bordetella pertussis]|nr:Uncharacterised protein [Bordetella pertussis]CFU02690.1 Uncharacterised protein [Bordetella pertussis]
MPPSSTALILALAWSLSRLALTLPMTGICRLPLGNPGSVMLTSPLSADRPILRCSRFSVTGEANADLTTRSPCLSVLSSFASLMSSSPALPLMPFRPKLASSSWVRTRPLKASPLALVGEMFSAGASTASSKGPPGMAPLARTASLSICSSVLCGSTASLGIATLASTLVSLVAVSTISPWNRISRPATSSDEVMPLNATLPRAARLLACAPGSRPSMRRSSLCAA